MAALQKGEVVVSEQFPAGLKVLVVDDSIPCLKILEKILRRCLYDVTICSQAVAALKLLRERKGFFDVVLSDVHMPDMDGYKLLELVGFEMDLPVIMMSVDGRTSAVMRGIRHGACDYLIKPIREEELKNIWQHVIRKKWNDNKGHEHSGSVDHNDNCKQGSENAEYACSADEGSEGMKSQRKRREAKEDDGELENDDPGTSKKPRVVWSVELHQQFVSAVNQLGIDKAVPKIILELMNVPGLTRENVASHLQKFRLYLKRLSGVAQHQGGTPNSFCGHAEQTSKLGSTGRFDIQALAAMGQIPPETLAALHAELLGQPSASLVFPAIDQLALLQASLQSLRCLPVDHSVTYGQPLIKCPSNMLKTFSQPLLSAEDIHSGFGSWPSCGLGTVSSSSSFGGLNAHNSNILMGVLQHQHQQLQQQKQSVVAEPSRLIPVQPSCLVVPSQSPSNFQSENSPDSVNQNCNINRSSAIDHSLLTPHSNSNSVGVRQISNGDLKAAGVLHGYLGPASISVSMSSCPMNAVNGTSRQVDCAIPTFSATRHMPRVISNMSCMDDSCSSKSANVIDPATLKNTGFVGKGKSIPSRFAVDELESPVSNWNNGKICKDIIENKVKQEPNLDFIENAKLGGPILQHSSQNDLMGVFSD